jgi:hypothetical protein
MATYYVRKTGSNAAAGTSTGTAWQTIGKALTSATGGDTVYVGGGTYREVVAVSASPGSTLTLIADVDGLNTGDFGEVVWTAFTTNDKTAASASATLDTNGKSNLYFKKFTLIGGGSTNVVITQVATTSQNCTFEDCTFICQSSSTSGVEVNANNNVALNWLFDRCRFIGVASVTAGQGMLRMYCVGSAVVDTNVIVRNCYFQGAGAAAIVFYGGNSPHFGSFGARGGSVIFNTAVGLDCFLYVNSWNIDGSLTANGNVIFCNTGFIASATGDLTESYNNNYATTTQTGLSGNGTGDKTGGIYAPLYQIGQELQQGRQIRPMMTPCSDSPSWAIGTTGSPPSVDLLNRTKPSGGGIGESTANKTPGALERHDLAVQETSVVDAGSNSIKITGPGDHRLLVPVDAVSTTITVRTRFTSGYTGSLPKAVINANGEIGVSTQTVTSVSAANTWSTLTFSAFTPSGRSWITLDLYSQDTSGTGIAYFDTITIS